MNRRDISALAGIALLYVALEAFGVTCPIRFLTGISCAGCGMSRAWLSLLRLDLSAAFAYHPLFLLPVPAAAVLMFRRRIPEWLWKSFLGTVCGLFVLVYLFRLFSPEDQIVVFQPSQGLFARLLSILLRTGGWK